VFTGYLRTVVVFSAPAADKKGLTGSDCAGTVRRVTKHGARRCFRLPDVVPKGLGVERVVGLRVCESAEVKLCRARRKNLLMNRNFLCMLIEGLD
jgi:hypothetical protein